VPALRVEAVTEATPEVVEAIGRLVPQLSSSPIPTNDEIARIVASGATTLFVARLASDGETEGAIVGALTLAVFTIPTGVRAWIEDVIVDESARGRGVGEALTLRAVEAAELAGARTVDLTSRPSREAANRLYQRLGFHPRETNVYRFEVSST
jgi:ribosomal protein S18 acetylase RimI-like enzyme